MKQLQGMLAFVETATSGSLRAAAERLEVTPAAVSKSLARLESQLGVRLLNRSTRRVALTAEGQRFLGKARAALRALDEAVADVTQAALAPSGRVRVSVGMAFGRRWVLPALPALAQRYPGLSVDVDLDNRPVDLVASGFDIGIRGGLIENSSLVARRICHLPLVLVASPRYLEQAGVPQTVDALAQHRLLAVHFAGAPPTPWRFRKPGARGARLHFTPEPRLSVSDPEALVDLVLADAGIAQTGLSHALPHLRTGRLRLLLPELHDPGSREMVLHYPHRQFLAPRVRAVVEALLEHFRQAADLHLTVAQVLEALPGAAAEASPARRSPARPRASVER
ncbi:LysR family transcriptional regulator [Aggregicoccus sp. 17bor-14]|uniref:LysR family transcriptional regulator n=1 Tax=Myxococcaceae TaxID=31 RepID=UPI00129CF5AB|nr:MULTISPECIES: LysR family transcriptional regulator [Myxococcaceae]MBF5042934.1 LysR family transcriptional regulator [Simulacricoccus sp. 17bor-14]MRI88700.1 LysR family transcriptional regulator [Aggregicoccus sp. 17bor-14]